MVFRPLAGCGLFPYIREIDYTKRRFPSPCGVWVVSVLYETDSLKAGFRPLAGCGLFPMETLHEGGSCWFPSPCGVWVVSYG